MDFVRGLTQIVVGGADACLYLQNGFPPGPAGLFGHLASVEFVG